MTFHLASTSAKNPRKAGLAAVKASYTSVSFRLRIPDSEAYHDRSHRHESIIDPPRLVDIPSLESDLETTTSHAESHGVHFDIWVSGTGFGWNLNISTRPIFGRFKRGSPTCPLLNGAEVPSGRTVFLSTKIGTLISTKLPLLSLMFAVKVLCISTILRTNKGLTGT
jgi:hypothetical protein